MKISCISTSAAILLLGGHVLAGAVGRVARREPPPPPDLAKMLATFQEKGPEFFPDNHPLDHPRYDKMCQVYMETEDGGHCYASIFCADGDVREYNKKHGTWNACFVGGRQFFTDPRIGDFSIIFAERDGFEQGQGLTTPIFQVKNFGDWLEIPVEGVARERRKKQKCDAHGGDKSGKDCGKGPMPCERDTAGNTKSFAKERRKKWRCLVPHDDGREKLSSLAGDAPMLNSKTPNSSDGRGRDLQRREHDW
ncbi:hypothetical protein BDU57DRAFT_512786 [Ampelomyces quisqualis]|uniref:Uncharacterized protein n=1 Tax=Ampelomyces quisqualis TaxID=50730 RepID=A0A6A5QV57_AMPQU|nr:hypothetical protein BDU57DRAFT_512786 [Ampelomyces quisqualis]